MIPNTPTLPDRAPWRVLRGCLGSLSVSHRGMLVTVLADYITDGTLPHHLPKPVLQAFRAVRKEWEQAETRDKKNDPLSFGLTEGERAELTARGVKTCYIDERLDRAVAYAKQSNRSVKGVLFLWWNADKKRYLAELERPRKKSYDTDDFFAAALQRSYDETPLDD